ncbi:glutamate-5-semialdehyde dehydrogenase [Olivibacter ginsenosidimutans]|uniref:Gamma-glutamyl phosphate reductase n=1 Tax=Olivibacter ginsenosidimutans TaxID=1176537 RepID=A0ABP9AXW6_9SPHI
MNYLHYFQEAKDAQQVMINLSHEKIDRVLVDLADAVEANMLFILEENQKDLDRMSTSDPKYDRLKLTDQRIHDIANDIRNIAKLASPIGEMIAEKVLPNALALKKVRVALGVVSVIYEARPNVTLDVFTLCFKTGNVTVLKGGSDAEFSNKALVQVIHKVLQEHRINPNVVILLPTARAATEALLQAVGYIDVLIPRGSQQLINYVRDHSKIPVIETGAGIVHTYFDITGDLEKGKAIIQNAKTRRVSVCNALDCLIIHRDRLKDLPALAAPLAEKNVELFADEASYALLLGNYPAADLHHADETHFGTEFLSLKLAIKTVNNLEEAMAHIHKYSSQHSEAIIAEDSETIDRFLSGVDAAAVYANVSTAFTDGAQFGLGAEIGISTQKLHARGPMALEELTSYKWLIRGDGQIRA